MIFQSFVHILEHKGRVLSDEETRQEISISIKDRNKENTDHKRSINSTLQKLNSINEWSFEETNKLQ